MLQKLKALVQILDTNPSNLHEGKLANTVFVFAELLSKKDEISNKVQLEDFFFSKFFFTIIFKHLFQNKTLTLHLCSLLNALFMDRFKVST